ncbi:LOW QUALITY PROTEIN: hypothetical protein HID58_087043 [Brassica napus]|uniref:Uncharacterized protein n=1 Tax=Brassica napus TaxID=3708 RepID=A0ABQ7XS75_BRANA|nr:LOW QUALITY PROTEIN: hypothetical protein HID58_087043 [Brassica napus]
MAHDELPEATQREAELQRQIDDLQGQVTGLHRAREDTNPELSSEFQILKEKLDEHSKRLEQSAKKLSQLESENLILRDENQALNAAGNKKRRFRTQVTTILFFWIPMIYALLQPLPHQLPPSRSSHLLNEKVPISHHILHLATEKEGLASQSPMGIYQKVPKTDPQPIKRPLLVLVEEYKKDAASTVLSVGEERLTPNAAMTQGLHAYQEGHPAESPGNSHYELRHRFSSKGNRARYI